MVSVKLNLGCGKEYRKGFVNVDKDYECNPDIVRDIELSLPFDDNSVSYVFMKDVLEHIKDYVFLFNELYRICENNATIWIQVPHALCEAAHDLDHRSYWTKRKFKQIADDFYSYAGIKGKFEIVKLVQSWQDDEITFIHCKYKVIK